ncbi:TPA: hypothetical protein ACJTOE_004603 [Klebsiella aerogenes]
MKKLLMLGVISIATTFANAEKWSSNFTHGSEENTLHNSFNESITFSCNESMGEAVENGFWFSKKGKVSKDANDGLAVLIDSAAFLIVPTQTKLEKDALIGGLLSSQLARASSSIGLFSLNQGVWLKIAQFYPDGNGHFEDCKPVFLRQLELKKDQIFDKKIP